MEMKKYLTYFVITATLISLFVPVASLKAQTCNPDTLTQVRYGQRSAAVKNLQACLMELGYNIPAGATGYYGSQTRTAVKNFYRDYLNMSWHGNWVGPQGIETLKSALVQAPAPEEEAQAPQAPSGISADVLAQVLQKIQAGDLQGALALLLGALGAQVPTTPSAEQPQPQPTEQAGEAVVEVRLAASPASGVVVKEGEAKDVLGIRVISRNAYSDVQRVRFFVSSTPLITKVFQAFELYDGETKLASLPASSYNRIAVNHYEYTFTGFSVRVPANGEKVLTIRAVVNPTVDSSDIQNVTFSIQVRSGDVRAVDGVGVQHTPNVSGTVARDFTVEKSTPTGVALVVYRDQNTPQSNNYAADSNRDVKDLELLRFVLRADNDTLKVQSISGSLTVSSTVTVSGLKLLDMSGNVLDSVANPGGSFTFQGVDFNTPLVTVNKDQTVTLKVLADLKVDASLSATSAATVRVSVTGAQAERSDGGSANWSGTVAGEIQYIYRVVAANWKVVSSNASVNTPDSGTSTLTATFRIQITAQRGDVYIPQDGFTATTTGATQISMGTPVLTPVSGVETSGAYYIVRNGNTGTLDVQFAVTPSSWNAGYHRVKLVSMTWDNDDNSGNGEITTNFPGTVETNTLTNAVYISR